MVSSNNSALERDRDGPSRRLFLKSATATGVVAGLGGVSVAQDDDDEAEGDEDEAEAETGGETVTDGPAIGLERVAEGLTAPVGMAVAPGYEDRYYIVDQVGQIYVLEDGDGAAMDEGDEEDAEEENGADEEEEPEEDAEDEMDEGATAEPEVFMDLSDRIVDVGGATDAGFDERGVLGLAFHPDFEENGRFFVRYSAPPTGADPTPEGWDHTAVLAEFTTEDDEGMTGDPDSETLLLQVPEPQFNHNAGDVTFGPDGYLYVPFGDGGDADDTGEGHVEDWYDENEGGNAQDTTENFLGGILRIDVDAEGENGDPYGIPEDNPLVDTEEDLDEYYAWGLRNPWRFSFDSEGNFYVADVGQNLFEEVNIVENGGNYGWNVKEGIECFSTDDPLNPPEDCPDSTPDDVRGGEELLDPVIQYPHQANGETIGISITGGYRYEGDTVSELEDMYVYGDWSDAFDVPSGTLFASPVEDYEATSNRSEEDLWEIQELSVAGSDDGGIKRFVLAFGRDHDGEVYVLTTARYTDGETGEVYRIVPEGEGETIEEHEDAVGTEEMDEEEDEEEEEAEDEEEEETEDDGEEEAEEDTEDEAAADNETADDETADNETDDA